MKSARNLVLRGSKWSFRITIPKKLRDLRAQVGASDQKKEFLKATGHSDLAQAKIVGARLLHEALIEFDSEIAQHTAYLHRLSLPRQIPTEAELEQHAFEFKAVMSAELNQERIEIPSRSQLAAELADALKRLHAKQADPDYPNHALSPESFDVLIAEGANPLRFLLEKRAAHLDALKLALSNSDYCLVDWAIRHCADKHLLDIPVDSRQYKILGYLLTRAMIQVLEGAERNFLERDVSQLSNVVQIGQSPRIVAQRAGHPLSNLHPTGGKKLSEYVDQYLDEKHRGEGNATRLQRRASIRSFVEICGDKPPNCYEKQDVTQYKAILRKLPANAKRQFKGKTALAVSKLTSGTGATQSIKTTNDKLNKLAVFGEWLGHNVDGVDPTIFRTTSFKVLKGDKIKVLPFSDQQIVAIFQSTPFIGCESERNQLVIGDYKIRDWRFWVPAIAAYTGARLNEITQLEVDDISQQENGIWVMNVTDEGEKQAVKTSKSKRSIPIHSTLIKLGLLDFIDRSRSSEQKSLFHAIRMDVEGRRSKHAGRTFRKLLGRLKIKDPSERGGMHRFRHSVIDKLRQADFQDHEFAPLLGHDSLLAPTTGGYGEREQLSMSHRKILIESITYPGLDIGLLSI